MSEGLHRDYMVWWRTTTWISGTKTFSVKSSLYLLWFSIAFKMSQCLKTIHPLLWLNWTTSPKTLGSSVGAGRTHSCGKYVFRPCFKWTSYQLLANNEIGLVMRHRYMYKEGVSENHLIIEIPLKWRWTQHKHVLKNDLCRSSCRRTVKMRCRHVTHSLHTWPPNNSSNPWLHVS